MSQRQYLFSVTMRDCAIETFRAGGPGGQNQNKRDTGVRITHQASGAIGVSREERSQLLNKRRAFRKMVDTKTFRQWIRIEAARLAGNLSIEESVDAAMAPHNLKIEVREKEQWVQIQEESDPSRS